MKDRKENTVFDTKQERKQAVSLAEVLVLIVGFILLFLLAIFIMGYYF